jgi:hypothetical protein
MKKLSTSWRAFSFEGGIADASPICPFSAEKLMKIH